MVSFQSLSLNDFTSHGIDVINLTTSFMPETPAAVTSTKSAASAALKGLTSLFFQASHNFVSAAESFLSNCALVIAGFGLGDGEGVACAACGCAKHTEVNSSKMPAANSRCFLIIGSPRVEK